MTCFPLRLPPVLLLLAVSVLSADGPVVGEKASYGLRWGFVSVGAVEISLGETDGGLFEAVLEAKANAFMRKVYNFHTIIVSRFAPGAERSAGYFRDEKATEDLHRTFFDWDANTVRYSKNGDERLPLPLQPGCQDPLSVVFAFRSGAVPLRPGTHRVWVSDGKVVEKAEFRVKGPETVKTPAGRFRAYRITADFGGVRAIFARPEGALIDVWLSDDARMLPVKLKSEATIGSFTSVLLEHTVPEADG
ncbi:MAG: DUF3108 domain-containing protein [Puniceicoccaceae bacterium]